MSYKICERCAMDTSDPDIVFDEKGICNHCKKYFSRKHEFVYDESKSGDLEKTVQLLKKQGMGKDYDCIIGVSGGVDSTYIAYLMKEYGLRPLAIHLDNGWNSELAVSNIEKALNTLGIDLVTYIINWQEFRDLQLSFLKASTPGMEIPTDHAITAILYQTAIKHNISNIILGANMSSELIMAPSWSEVEGQRDWLLIKNVHNKFGTKKLKTFPHFSWYDFYKYKGVKKIKMVSILDHINYSKDEAIKVLEEKLGWQYYGGKHYESIYTRFTQGYIQPSKFGFDKRRAHYSNLICRGDISRDDVLKVLDKNPYPNEEMLKEDTAYFKKKLGLTDEAFEEIMMTPAKSYKDYSGYFNSELHNWVRKMIFKMHNVRKSLFRV